MKRSVSYQFMRHRSAMVAFLMVLSVAVLAQDEKIRESQSVSISTTHEGKVKLKVVQKKGNDETTFEKTYDSREEMQNDPDLEKYGIDKNALGFSFGGNKPQFFFHNGPAQGFWDDEDFDMSPFLDMQERMQEMMRGFGGNFAFDFDNDSFMDMDSLVKRFDFRNDNGRFFFNGEEIMDVDSLRDAMKDQFQGFRFNFDFDDWGDRGNFGSWSYGDEDDRDDVRVITRAKVMVRSANEDDKKAVGTNEMESLELRDINFYPNPSDGRFDVELETKSDAPVQVIIVDDGGNEVFNRVGKPSDGQYVLKVDLSSQGKGIYIMKLVQNGKALTKRLVIE